MNKEITREKHIIDATDQSFGRLATQVAILLRGKHKPSFELHMDCGDFVNITNIDKVKVTGKKKDQKKYHRYSGYPSGIKEKTMGQRLEVNPQELFKDAVLHMMPTNKLRSKQIKRLTVE